MKIVPIAFLFISCIALKNSNSNFYDKVINDFRDDCYFLSIKSENKVTYIVENDDLYYYLQKQKAIDKEQYIKKIKEKLINKSTIEIDNPNSNFIKF
jgi:hypothetical protein